jgi:hypothetical protein
MQTYVMTLFVLFLHCRSSTKEPASLVGGLSGRTCRQLIAVTCSHAAFAVSTQCCNQKQQVECMAAAANAAGLVLTVSCAVVLLLPLLTFLPPTAQVNSLTSFETDLPYEYYSMPFCKPNEGVHRAGNAANLGTVIMGIKLLNSQYNFTIMVRTSHAAAPAVASLHQQKRWLICSSTCGMGCSRTSSSVTVVPSAAQIQHCIAFDLGYACRNTAGILVDIICSTQLALLQYVYHSVFVCVLHGRRNKRRARMHVSHRASMALSMTRMSRCEVAAAAAAAVTVHALSNNRANVSWHCLQLCTQKGGPVTM